MRNTTLRISGHSTTQKRSGVSRRATNTSSTQPPDRGASNTLYAMLAPSGDHMKSSTRPGAVQPPPRCMSTTVNSAVSARSTPRRPPTGAQSQRCALSATLRAPLPSPRTTHNPCAAVLVSKPRTVCRPPRSSRSRSANSTNPVRNVHTVGRDIRDGRSNRRRRCDLNHRRLRSSRPGSHPGRHRDHDHHDDDSTRDDSSPPPHPVRASLQRRDRRWSNGRISDQLRHSPLELGQVRHRAHPPRPGPAQVAGARQQASTTPCCV